MILCPTKAERTTKGRMRITSRHKKPDFCAFSSALLCNKAATFSFLDKVFGAAHSPPRRGGVSATSKTMDPFRSVADGVVSSAHLRRPAALTTITASRYCARASRPSAPLLWLRGIFLMAQPLLRLRPIGLALRALLCEEGNMTHSSSVQTATSSAFGCGVAALSLLWLLFPLRQGLRNGQRRPAGSGGGDPLMSSEGKSAFEVTLDWKRMRSNEPGAVGILRREQESHAF